MLVCNSQTHKRNADLNNPDIPFLPVRLSQIQSFDKITSLLVLRNEIQPNKFEALTDFIKPFMNWAAS